jgi:osmotically-inducible protein OsmY
MIAVKPRAEPAEIWKKIHEALKRDAEVDANRALVETNRSEILSGTRSWLERHEAERGVVGTGRHHGGRQDRRRPPMASAWRGRGTNPS